MIILLFLTLQEAPTYAGVHDLFIKHCVSCHNSEKRKAGLNLESHGFALKGGENGTVVTAGKPESSELLRRISLPGGDEDRMPPKGDPLTSEHIARIRAWIAAGAPAPKAGEVLAAPIPKVEPKVPPRRGVTALAVDPKTGRLAVPAGANDALFTHDGALLIAAGGEPGVGGALRFWKAADGAPVRTVTGHADAILSAALSPDGTILASGSYDKTIGLWETASGKAIRTLPGHNGAIFDVAFSPDGKLLASASADRTVKLWDTATGERRDTLTESTQALHALAFSGRTLAAGGVDNRIRVWEIGPEGREGTNVLRATHFAHEGAILALRYSPDGKTLATSADDRTVKLWNGADLSPRAEIERQPDWPAALAFTPDSAALIVGRLDGSLGRYAAKDGAPAAPPKPEFAARPRGIQRGVPARLRLNGKNLSGLAAAPPPKLKAVLLPDEAGLPEAVSLVVTAEPDLPPGVYDLNLGASLPFHVEAIPQLSENDAALVPSSVWGTLEAPGDADAIAFEARAGQSLVFDVASKRIGSKADVTLAIADAAGRVMATANGPEPLLTHTFAAAGRYTATVSDLTQAGSADHFYRLSVGELAVVTDCFPLSVPAGAESEVRLVGVNVDATVRVKAGGPGDLAVPVDPERFRARRALSVVVTAAAEPVEREPNDAPVQASPLPGGANGRFDRPGDADLYRFDAKAGQRWVIETAAAQRGSRADTRLEVLHADGKPVERLLLRAVLNSYNNWRAIDANGVEIRMPNMEEMELRQYLYMQGEVGRLFRAPRGPDSAWFLFSAGGKRVTYFDTNPVGHAFEEACYIVEPHPPGARLPNNGLPVFPLYYANDDDGLRRLGADSRLHFTAPTDGTYLVRVTETRGSGGDRFAYRLILREARPDFTARVQGLNAAIPPGSGRSFEVVLDRQDGFDDAVTVEFAGVPPGYTITSPLTVEAGHLSARGAILATADAKGGGAITAMARAGELVRPVGGLTTALSTAPKPKLRVFLEPAEITIAPGQEVAAKLRVERDGHEELVTFEVENLPFGIIVSDIGLNGVLIPKGQNERGIFLACARWVEPTDRPCYARANEADQPVSPPVMVKVRKP